MFKIAHIQVTFHGYSFPFDQKKFKKVCIFFFFFFFFFHFYFVFAYNKNKSVYPSVFCDNSDLEILITSCGKGEPILLESQRTKYSFFYGEKNGGLGKRPCPLQVHDFHNISLFPNNLSLNSLCSS